MYIRVKCETYRSSASPQIINAAPLLACARSITFDRLNRPVRRRGNDGLSMLVGSGPIRWGWVAVSGPTRARGEGIRRSRRVRRDGVECLEFDAGTVVVRYQFAVADEIGVLLGPCEIDDPQFGHDDLVFASHDARCACGSRAPFARQLAGRWCERDEAHRVRLPARSTQRTAPPRSQTRNSAYQRRRPHHRSRTQRHVRVRSDRSEDRFNHEPVSW